MSIRSVPKAPLPTSALPPTPISSPPRPTEVVEIVRPPTPEPHPARQRLIRGVMPFFVLGSLLLIWQFATRDGGGFMRATPTEVGAAFAEMITSGVLFQHIGATLAEIAIGFGLGISLAVLLGYSLSKVGALQRLLLPYLVGIQAIPIVAIAPLLITYLGPGIVTNGIICALIVFFPMLITTNVALRSVSPDHRDLMRSMLASPLQTFFMLELPTALPAIFGGLKVSTTLAVIGAVVGEGVSAEFGLGYLVYYSRYVFNQSSVFVGLITLIALAYVLYELVTVIERRALRWRYLRDQQH